jgi:hypothetical protein
MINAVDLTKSPPTLDAVPVKRTFGKSNMYKDDSIQDQMHVEKKFSRLENDARCIIARVVVAHTKGEGSIELSRADKDLLRKFLFVMKYRGLNLFERFNHQTMEDYKSNDRDAFLEYMRKNGFKRPLDVWFDNMLKIIDAPMDPGGRWVIELSNSVYAPDALWLFINMLSMHLSFVTPADANDEFVLTGNAFGIHEGPVSYSVNRSTGEQTQGAYTEFHLLNIISPQLAMILRHNSLPDSSYDVDSEICNQKRDTLMDQARSHTDPEHATSLLVDLPVSRAGILQPSERNNWLVTGDGGSDDPNETFHFVFFRLKSRHVQMINTVMLDQAHNTSMLVYKSEVGLRKALEFYLDYPTQSNGGHSIKTITDRQDDPMLLLFRKLEYVAHAIGSSVKAKYHVDPLMDDNDGLSFDEAMTIVLKTAKPITRNHFIDIAMVVMVEVVEKMQMNIRAMHALDRILIADGTRTYPELIFMSVQQVNRAGLNQYTNVLPAVDLQTWMRLWDVLVQRALQQPGADAKDDINNMQNMVNRLGPNLVADLRRGSERGNDVRLGPPNLGLSRLGITKAFDTIGRDEMTSDINHTEPITETSDLSSRFEASPISSRQGDAKEELLPAPLKLERCIDIQTTKQDNDGVDVFDPQPLFKLIAIILLGALWWLD